MLSILINFLNRLSGIPIIGILFRMLMIAITGDYWHMPNERGAVVPPKLLAGRIIRFVVFMLFVAAAFVGYQLIKPDNKNQPAEIDDTGGSGFETSIAIGDTEELDLDVWIVDSETNFNFFKKYPSAERPLLCCWTLTKESRRSIRRLPNLNAKSRS